MKNKLTLSILMLYFNIYLGYSQCNTNVTNSNDGTQNYIPRYVTGSGNISCLENSLILDNGTYVGISIPTTLSPTEKLDVEGRINVGGSVFLNNVDPTNFSYKIGQVNVLQISKTTGVSYNLNLGWGAGAANIGGSAGNNLNIGLNAGNKLVTGSHSFDNVYIGAYSGAGVGATGNDCERSVFIGNSSGTAALSGEYNVFVGHSAGYNSNGVGHNSFLGGNAGYSSTSGKENVYIGLNSGYWGVGATDYNTFIGVNSGVYNIAASNTYLGKDAGYGTGSCAGCTTAIYNTFMGIESGSLAS